MEHSQSYPKKKIDVLLVEDSESDYLLTNEFLTAASVFSGGFIPEFSVRCAEDLQAATQILDTEHFDIILADLTLPDAVGIETLEKLHELAPDIPIIILSGVDDQHLAVRAVQAHAQDYLLKDKIDGEILARSILYALERHRFKAELEKSRDAAILATQKKAEFLAHVSHEIRTPLTSILGYAELLKNSSLNHAQREDALETVLRNGHHLHSLLANVLDLSKIEAEGNHFQVSSCAPYELLQEIRSLVRQRAESKGINFYLHIDEPLPATVLTDATALRQVLLNLITNAIKFTEEGCVTVTAGCDWKSEQLSIIVSDTGPGLSDEEIARIFQPFEQTSLGASSHFRGSGLGLTIAQKLVTKLHGSLEVQSAVGVGSQFFVTIPTGALDGIEKADCAIAPHSSREDDAENAQENNRSYIGRVLLVDDVSDSRRLTTYFLRDYDLDVVSVSNGYDAIAKFSQEPFDLILMDMRMPGIDGHTTTSRLREMGCEVPIIAFTANALKEDIELATKVGCDDYLTKPFSRKTLGAILGRYLTARNHSESARHPDRGNHDRRRWSPSTAEFEAIRTEFRENLRKYILPLKRAEQSQDLDVMAEIAHKLKASVLYGYPELGQSAAALHIAARSKNKDSATTFVKELLAEAARITGEAPQSMLQPLR